MELNEIEKYVCPNCNEVFRLRFNFRQHMKKHGVEIPKLPVEKKK